MSDHGVSKTDGLRTRLGGPWSREKLGYLGKYAKAFSVAMSPKRDSGKWSALYYFDPLCGPGVDAYKKNGEEFPGSPRLALTTEPPFDCYFFGDLDPENVAALKPRIPGELLSRVSIEAADCHDRAKHLVSRMSRRALGLAFVDPEGFEADFRMFETLSQRAVDIVYLFPSGIGIVRNVQNWVQQSQCPIDDLWGGREWRDLPMAKMAAGLTPTMLGNEAVYASWAEAFCKRVATLGYQYYDIKGPLKNETNAPMYHLLFFSKSDAGLKIWRNVQRIDPRGQRHLRFGE